LDQDWIRIQFGLWIWIKKGKEDPKKESEEFPVLKCWNFLRGAVASSVDESPS
jgi:hypothetical protein